MSKIEEIKKLVATIRQSKQVLDINSQLLLALADELIALDAPTPKKK